MRKGFAFSVLSKIVLFIATLAVFASATVLLMNSKNVFDAMSQIDEINIDTIMDETCYVLDNAGDDREAEKTDTYENIPIERDSKPANIGDVHSFALSFEIKGIIHESSWNIAGWEVTCDGKDADGNDKTYRLVRWDYTEIYPNGYLHIDAKKFFDDLLLKYLIDNTESGYKPEWQCGNEVTVNLMTASAEGSGTDEMVKLCYYLNKELL
ncbi:MAG: hypothetical protein KAT83_02025 [Candidatus Aenigmarchaeota archaeon]|nr:hypothetical protein [Candidatus Aenigmarchaeota archaeon]